MGSACIQMIKLSVLVFIIGFHSVNTLFLNKTCIVHTTSGLVKGKVNEYKGFRYYSFQGIPYAESPVGDKRFAPPVPKKPWSHILDATREGSVCLQKDDVYNRNRMNEDCLLLNVYVPANTSNKLLPTLVTIHGGAFSLLSGDSDYIYGPQFLLQKDILFISMNFRLHAFGFLSLNISEAEGNVAVKDVVLSLKWIKKNVVNFGGDSDKITIIGNSSGASLAHLLLFTTKTNDLFQQVILVSGNTLGRRTFAKYPKNIALLLANELNIKTNNFSTLLRILKKIDAFDIVAANNRMADADHNILRTHSVFTPCVERDSAEAIINTDPIKILENGLPQNVRILAGFNTNEGLYLFPRIMKNAEGRKHLNENPELLIPSEIEYPRGSAHAKKLADSITEFYFGKNKLSGNSSHITCIECLIQYITDIQYVYDVERWIKKHKARKDSKELYFYEFAFDGQLNWAKLFYNIAVPGVAHADELGYLFLTRYTSQFYDKDGLIDKRSIKMSHTMQNLFSNFIKYGNPTPPAPDTESNIFWPEYGEDQNYLRLNDEIKVMQSHSSERANAMNFWDEVYNDYNEYVKNGGVLEEIIIP